MISFRRADLLDQFKDKSISINDHVMLRMDQLHGEDAVFYSGGEDAVGKVIATNPQDTICHVRWTKLFGGNRFSDSNVSKTKLRKV